MGNDENPNGRCGIQPLRTAELKRTVPFLERSPRGIPGFSLTGGNFTTWKVQGKLGGYTQYVKTFISMRHSRLNPKVSRISFAASSTKVGCSVSARDGIFLAFPRPDGLLVSPLKVFRTAQVSGSSLLHLT